MSDLFDKILKYAPMQLDFRPASIADKIYPNLCRQTKSGQVYNLGCAVISRELRKHKSVLEVTHGTFWIDETAFVRPPDKEFSTKALLSLWSGTVEGKNRIIRKISKRTKNEFSAVYAGHDIEIEKDDKDTWYAQVTHPNGCYVVDGYFGVSKGYTDLDSVIKMCIRNILM